MGRKLRDVRAVSDQIYDFTASNRFINLSPKISTIGALGGKRHVYVEAGVLISVRAENQLP